MSDLTRVEQLLRNALGEDIYEVTPQSRVEILLAQLNELIEGLSDIDERVEVLEAGGTGGISMTAVNLLNTILGEAVLPRESSN